MAMHSSAAKPRACMWRATARVFKASRGIRRVQVGKVPFGQVLAAEDAIKVAAPELIEDTYDPTVYVRREFLNLPTI